MHRRHVDVYNSCSNAFMFLLDSGLHVADAVIVTEAPLAAARDVDDAAPLVTAA
jgi:hypothetical protein